MDHTLTFGQWLKQRRKDLLLTQAAVAKLVGCAAITIRKLEADALRPSAQIAAHLAQHLDLEPDEQAPFATFARTGHWPATPRSATAALQPMETPSQPPGNLPVQRERLIGREADLAAVCELLLREDVGLVTLTGVGGTGKTRLALEVAMQVRLSVAGGVWFVDLALIGDPALVLSTIAATLGVRETGGQPLLESLKAVLRPQQILLVLDNFEQVVPAAGVLADLLNAAPRLKILVTSRVVLHLYAEQEYPVPPLALPDSTRLPPPEALHQYAAVTLFIHRARAVKPDFRVTNANALAIAEICARLDGLPLALELAAARVKLFPPQALLARLTQRLTTLTGGARDLPARHQTLRGAIDWSYNLLAAEEQRLFARLGVFVGGCTLEAAEAVCGRVGGRQAEVLAGLASLVDHSLVRQQESVEGEPRFTMLETLREYALERLEMSGQEDVLRCRHAEYYLELAEAAEPALRSARQVAWGARLEREHDNLRAALRWFISRGDADQGLRMGGALWRFWGYCGHILDGRDILAELLALPGGGAGPRARALLGAGSLVSLLGTGDDAAALFEQSAALFRKVGDRWGQAFALSYREFEVSWSEHRVEESAALFEQLGEPWGLALAFVLRSELAGRQQDPVARSLGAEGVRRFRELGDRWFLITVLGHMVDVARRLCDWKWHQQLLDERLRLTREVGDKAAIVDGLHSQAMEARWQGDYEQAAACYDACVLVLRELGLSMALAAALHGRGMVAYHQDDVALAQALFDESLCFFKEGEHQGVGWCFEGLAGIAGRQGQPWRAARLLGAGDVLAHFDTWHGHPSFTEYQEIVAAARVQLDRTEWDAAWMEGQAMPLEEAIAYALEPTVTVP